MAVSRFTPAAASFCRSGEAGRLGAKGPGRQILRAPEKFAFEDVDDRFDEYSGVVQKWKKRLALEALNIRKSLSVSLALPGDPKLGVRPICVM